MAHELIGFDELGAWEPVEASINGRRAVAQTDSARLRATEKNGEWELWVREQTPFGPRERKQLADGLPSFTAVIAKALLFMDAHRDGVEFTGHRLHDKTTDEAIAATIPE